MFLLWLEIFILAGLIIGVLSILWFVIAALLEERVPNALIAKEGYIFDYVVGKQITINSFFTIPKVMTSCLYFISGCWHSWFCGGLITFKTQQCHCFVNRSRWPLWLTKQNTTVDNVPTKGLKRLVFPYNTTKAFIQGIGGAGNKKKIYLHKVYFLHITFS